MPAFCAGQSTCTPLYSSHFRAAPPQPGAHPSSPQGPEVAHLDPADSFLSLHHSDVFGGVALREQLGGAQVVGCKDDSIDEVLWLTGPWN